MASSQIRHVHGPARPRAAIVFVHGFQGGLEGTWERFPDWLAADPRLRGWGLYSFGYSTRLVPDIVGIWRADAALEDLARLFATTLESAADLAAGESLVFLAHSMGGLVLQRALLNQPSLRDRARHVFLFGTPSAGLAKASPFTFWKRQFRDMAEDAAFIRALRGDWERAFGGGRPFSFLTIAGEIDQFVPPESSLLPFPEEQRRVVPGDHSSMVKPEKATALCVDVVLQCVAAEARTSGPLSALALSVESGNFRKAIEDWWPHRQELDDAAAVQLALALEAQGRQADAIALLERHGRRGTDVLGVLAGRLKRRWLVGRRRADAERALALYREGYEEARAGGDIDQALYLGVNVAFMELAYGQDFTAAHAVAEQVLEWCAAAATPGRRADPAKVHWRHAAQGEASLVLGRGGDALAGYRRAVAARPQPWEVRSMQQQALRLADLVGADEDLERSLDEVFGPR